VTNAESPQGEAPIAATGPDPAADEADTGPPTPQQPAAGWTRRARLGTALLVGLFVGVGLFAAWTVTPAPDEEALARPIDSDVVLAGAIPLSWDPARIGDSLSAQVLAQVYEGLTALDADARVQPALAETWTVEDGGERIRFVLRDDLTFSDGTPITAADVRRSWLRVLDPASPSPLASMLDDVAGARAYAAGEGSAEAVGIIADGATVEVAFDRPAAYFPAVAASPTLAVVPPSIEAQARWGGEGTFTASGAYVPIASDAGELRLAASETYWAGAAPTSRITLVTDDGGRSEVDVFEDGALDWTSVTAADASWIRYDRYLGPQLRHSDEIAVDVLGFDTTRPPFDDAAVRRAVTMAVDWRHLAALDGSSRPPTSIVPPGAAGRSEQDFLLPYDPDAARAELASAGYPGGEGFPDVSIATYGVGASEAIAADLERELGIEVAVELRGFEDHSRLLDEDTPSMWTLGWSADYPHAHDFLGLLLAGDSSANLTGWSDPEFDALLAAAAATDDEAEQVARYDEAQAIVRDAAPLIPLGYGEGWYLSREGLRGAAVSGVGLLRYADLAWSG
jgi:oligopeptide transport system substrate-binding protein